MRNKTMSPIILAVIISITWVSQAFSLSRPTHRNLNEEIAVRNINRFCLNDYLINQLGFTKGVQDILKKDSTEKAVRWWLGEGGDKDDEPEGLLRYPTNTARNNRHFHNPLKDWGNAGLSTIVFTAESLVLWAQNPSQDVGGKWAWNDARDYFHKGLTATVKTERDSFFAKTFRALGQQMHLVHDSSVPEHVRNDIHIKKAYEDYVEKIRTDRNKQNIWLGWLGNPITYDRSILDIASTHPTARLPISRIIDTDRYINNNPDITRTLTGSQNIILPQPIGLAE